MNLTLETGCLGDTRFLAPTIEWTPGVSKNTECLAPTSQPSRAKLGSNTSKPGVLETLGFLLRQLSGHPVFPKTPSVWPQQLTQEMTIKLFQKLFH